MRLPTRTPSSPGLFKRIDDYIQRTLGRIDDFIDRVPDLPAMSCLELESMRFYESGSENPKREERQYAIRFPQQTTRYIRFEACVKKRHRQRGRRFSLVYRYYNCEGSVLAEVRSEWMIKAEWVRSWKSQGLGWPHPGQWTPGEYDVHLLLDGMEIAKSRFIIEPPPLPPPPAANLHQASVRFYPAVAGALKKENRQDSVRFPHQTTREVICELTVRNHLYQQRSQTYHLTTQCYTAEGKLLWEGHHNWLIMSEEQEPSISWRWGWQSPENWRVGVYRVEVLISGADFAWGAFVVE